MGTTHGTLEQRLNRSIVLSADWDCWITKLKTDSSGYGHIKHLDGFVDRTHRVSWKIFKGEIPAGMCVLHRCDVPACVNPRHLWLGTRTDNNADKWAKKRQPTKLTEEQVLAIRQDHRKLKEVASDYGVTESTISVIRNRIQWKHL